MCSAHYQQWAHGKPFAPIGKRWPPLEERFWSYVAKGDGCWVWTGTFDSAGYGTIEPGVTIAPRGKRIKAHRLSWELHNGPIPAGLGVLHKCDNPPCVNPAHLFLGDQRANMADCAAKARTTRGERHPGAVLTESAVTDIRKRIAAGEKRKDLANEYGVRYQTLVSAANGQSWRHLS